MLLVVSYVCWNDQISESTGGFLGNSEESLSSFRKLEIHLCCAYLELMLTNSRLIQNKYILYDCMYQGDKLKKERIFVPKAALSWALFPFIIDLSFYFPIRNECKESLLYNCLQWPKRPTIFRHDRAFLWDWNTQRTFALSEATVSSPNV